MATAMNALASRYQSTRSEVVEFRVEIAATRTVTRAPAVVQATVGGLSELAYIPSVSNLRGDPVLAAQAAQLVADLRAHTSGNGPSLNSVENI
jgi:hypothetical protein